MSPRLLPAILLLVFAAPAHALDQSIVRQLQALEPGERVEQRCDIEAMDRIRDEQDGFRPDKVIAYTFSDTELDGTELRAPGAVVRSRGEWYRLNYRCETGPKGLKVKSFDYELGARVPHEEWSRHYLYN